MQPFNLQVKKGPEASEQEIMRLGASVDQKNRNDTGRAKLESKVEFMHGSSRRLPVS